MATPRLLLNMEPLQETHLFMNAGPIKSVSFLFRPLSRLGDQVCYGGRRHSFRCNSPYSPTCDIAQAATFSAAFNLRPMVSWQGSFSRMRIRSDKDIFCPDVTISETTFGRGSTSYAVPKVTPSSRSHLRYAMAVRSERRCSSAWRSSGSSSGRWDSTIGTSCQVIMSSNLRISSSGRWS